MSTVLNFIGLPSPSAFVKKFLLVTDVSNHDINVPKNIKREFFQLDETFLTTNKNSPFDINLLRKVGKNDALLGLPCVPCEPHCIVPAELGGTATWPTDECRLQKHFWHVGATPRFVTKLTTSSW